MRLLLLVISLVVPRALRSRWREEWLAETRAIAAARGWWTACRAAAGAFFDAVAVRRVARQAHTRRMRPLHGLAQDIKYSVRGLLAARLFSFAVIASLAVGLAATTAAFGFLHAVIFRGFPGVSDQERLVRLEINRGCGRPGCWLWSSTPEDYALLRRSMPSVQDVTARIDTRVAVRIGTEPFELRAALVSTNTFDVLGLRPALGRGFTEQESALASASVAVIAHSLWQRRFGGDPAVLGRFIEVGGRPMQIVGVAPARFGGVGKGDVEVGGDYGLELYLPLAWTRQFVTPEPTDRYLTRRTDEYRIFYVGRLHPGATLEQAQRDTERATAIVKGAHPQTHADAWVEAEGVWANDPRTGSMLLAGFMLVPMLVLAIACVNAANLMLARATERARDIAVRRALGAGRWRIVRQTLTESAVLVAAAGIVAVPLTWALLRLAAAAVGIPVPLDTPTVVFATTTCLLCAFGCGLAVAVRAVSRRDLLLGSTRSDDAGPSRMLVRRLLVAVQVSLSLALLASGGQSVAAIRELLHRDVPAPERVLLASFDLGLLKLPRPAAEQFYRDLLERATQIPGVERGGLAHRSAIWSWGRGHMSSINAWRLEDQPRDGTNYVGGYAAGDLFGALGVAIVDGRDFGPQDATPHPSAVIVSKGFADRMFQGSAVGRRIRIAGSRQRHAESIEVPIIGVLAPVGERDNRGGAPRSLYVASPLEHEPAMTLYLRTRVPADEIVPALRAAVRALNDRVPISEIATLDAIFDRRYFEEHMSARMVTGLGVIALALAVAGVYAVVAFTVSRRQRELGIRIALGADPRAVLRLVLTQSLRLAVIGSVLGTVGAIVIGAVIHHSILGAPSIDPLFLLAAMAVLTATMAAASIVPARRALRVNPVDVLRTE